MMAKALGGQARLAASSLQRLFSYFSTSFKAQCSPGPRAFQQGLTARQAKPVLVQPRSVLSLGMRPAWGLSPPGSVPEGEVSRCGEGGGENGLVSPAPS